MARLHQITEDDLAELERVLPQLQDALSLSAAYDARQRTQLRRCKSILSDVRWGYGPPEQVETVAADQDGN